MYLDKLTPALERIVQTAYPEYKGRKFQIVPSQGQVNLRSAWSDGSRTTHVFMDLATCKHIDIPESGGHWCQPATMILPSIPVGYAVVQHVISCGKDLGIVIRVAPETMNQLALPPAGELLEDEKIVLAAIRSLKSSYAGIPNYRFHCVHKKTGITLERWNEVKESLTKKGYLNKAGAITPNGKNVLESVCPNYWHWSW